MKHKAFRPDRVQDYFLAEWKVLLIVTVTGLVYNIGLLAGPWFEGRMTGKLVDILTGSGSPREMGTLALGYALTILVVQGNRYFKRFYVRRFANNVSRRMKQVLYAKLVARSRVSLISEGEGSIMTKAIGDVDDCVEGMRKFTTELFDTGVALLAYCGMLLHYDWRLALICMLFPPISYAAAEKLKTVVQKTGEQRKEQSAALNAATLDRARNALTYRVFGREEDRRQAYEENLDAYESAAIRANVWNTSMVPIYRSIALLGIPFLLWFGQKNVMDTGWSSWDIAAFTTFLACFTKLARKASRAAKLFNAVHKAQVSWHRVKPLLAATGEALPERLVPAEAAPLRAENLCFAYPGGEELLHNVSFQAQPGQIIGITGAVACGKSTLGKAFLCELPYEGSITFGGEELRDMDKSRRSSIFGYLGHDPELLSASVRENICMGDTQDPVPYLRAVCLDREVREMEQGLDTLVGPEGHRLSGGQAQRLALARTLYHKRPVLILDDPFSALDKPTEAEIFRQLRILAKDSIVLLISHRLYQRNIWLSLGIVLTVVGAVVAALLPPLVLAKIVDTLTAGTPAALGQVLLYFGLLALTGLLESARESLLTVFGQKITHGLRSCMMAKLTRLTSGTLAAREPGELASRFVGDVDTVENLFSAGIISMFADLCKIVSILVVLSRKNLGLCLVLLCLLPPLFFFTRYVQKNMLRAQIANRQAVGRASAFVPTTMHNIRTVHALGKERYMCARYDDFIDESYAAMEKTNFYDAIYSPVILILKALVVGIVMLLSATGNAGVPRVFGMSAGTAVAVISYIGQIFTPVESLGMEIQSIQSAMAGVRRIDELLAEPERTAVSENVAAVPGAFAAELKNVSFGYEDKAVLENLTLQVSPGEQVTLSGRTGAGKSTVLKLLLGLYSPQSGAVELFGIPADRIPEGDKRRLTGYVEQSFHMVPGTVGDQITLYDDTVSPAQVRRAAELVGLLDTVEALPRGFDTVCAPELFSQGQWQLLSIARAAVTNPQILLLDEITANLDAETERMVLQALKNVSENRTVISISHRTEAEEGRIVPIGKP